MGEFSMDDTADCEVLASCKSTPTVERTVINSVASASVSLDEQPAPPGTNDQNEKSPVINAASVSLDEQPVPHGATEIEEFPFLKSLEECKRPLIGLEFVFEQPDERKKLKYMCLLCSDSKFNGKSIIKHLTNQKHYLTYLELYFPQLFSVLDVLKTKLVNKKGFKILVSRLIGKLEEKYGQLRPTIFSEAVDHLDSLKEIMLNYPHFKESPEDEPLKEMLTEEYVENVDLLMKNFPLKSKSQRKENPEKDPKTCESENEVVESPKTQSSPITAHDSGNVDAESMDLATLSSLEKRPIIAKSEIMSKSVVTDSYCSDMTKILDMSAVKKKTSRSRNEREKTPVPGCEIVSDIESNDSSGSSKVVDAVSKSPSQLNSISQQKACFRRKPSRHRSRKRSSTPFTPSRKYSRSRSPVLFRAVSKCHEKRNFRKRSRGSSPRYSPRRRSYSPPHRRRYSSSSCSSSSSENPPRVVPTATRSIICHTAESHSRRNSFEYREAVREIKYDRFSKHSRNTKRSRSPTPKRRKSPKRQKSPKRDPSTITWKPKASSPGKRLRRMLAHENLPKNTECVVRVDTAKSYSAHHNNNNIEGGKRNIARVTSEVTVELKSTVESKKSTDVNENDLTCVYDQKLRVIKKRLQHERRSFRKSPEAYPMFEEEWKSFWCRRFKEIQDGGVDNPHTYDYKPDWMRYWLERVKLIYKEKYKKLKTDLKENLGILDKNKNKNVPDSEVVEISDEHESGLTRGADDGDTLDKANQTPQNDCAKDLIEDENERLNEETTTETSLASMTMLNLLTQTISACMSSTYSQNSPQSTESSSTSKDSKFTHSNIEKNDESVDIDLKDELSLISVLRQLSVLESYLGSSAPQVTNLLAKGLTEEKIKPGSSVKLLTQENRLFLDVVKEKLKGQLILEVLPGVMVKATKRCIKSIDALMKLVPEPKTSFPQVDKIQKQHFVSRNSATSFPPVTHAQFHSNVNIPLVTYSTPQMFPTSTVYSAPSMNQSTPVYSASVPPPTAPLGMSHSHYSTRPELYPTTVAYGSSLSSAYPMHPVNPPVSIHSTSIVAVPGHTSTHRPNVSTRHGIVPSTAPLPVGHPSCTGPAVSSVGSSPLSHSPATHIQPSKHRSNVPNRHSIVPSSASLPSRHTSSTGGCTVPPVGSDLLSHSPATHVPPTSTTLNRPKPTKRPSIYDKIPWSEQLVASNAANTPSSQSRPGVSLSLSSYATSSTDSRSTSSISSSGFSRGLNTTTSSSGSVVLPSPANATSNGFRAPLATLSSSSDARVPVATSSSTSPQELRVTSSTSVSGELSASAVSSSRIPPVSSSTSGGSPSMSVAPIIDLTDVDDDVESDISSVSVDKLSESQLIQMLTRFRELPRARLEELIDFLRKLENTNPEAVEKFKKYVKIPPSE